MSKKPAKSAEITKRPLDWDKAVSAAYLRLLDKPREKVVGVVGINERTLFNWEHSPWWHKAQEEAMDKWLHGLRATAMEGAKVFAKTDPTTTRWALDRLVKKLAPPTQKQELTGADGGPIKSVSIELKATLEDYDNIVKRLESKNASHIQALPSNGSGQSIHPSQANGEAS